MMSRARAADRIGKIALATTLHVHAKADGRGHVFDGERLLSEVDYAIKDVEEELETMSLEGRSTGMVHGQRNIYGVIRVPPAVEEVLSGYVGAGLTLQLEDGRRLPFTISKVMRTQRFLVQGLQELGALTAT